MPTDNELRREVERELEWEPRLDERRIGVPVDGGIVTLTGEVKSCVERWKAERTVERVKGLGGVANELSVHTSVDRTNTDIAKAAGDALRWNVSVPTDSVKVRVDKGWLILEGEVPWDYQRREAEPAVRILTGVKGISSLIQVKPQVALSKIEERIEETFKREAAYDASRIILEVFRRGGDASRFVAFLGATPRSREGRLVGSRRYTLSQHDHRRPGARRSISLPIAVAGHVRSCALGPLRGSERFEPAPYTGARIPERDCGCQRGQT